MKLIYPDRSEKLRFESRNIAEQALLVINVLYREGLNACVHIDDPIIKELKQERIETIYKEFKRYMGE